MKPFALVIDDDPFVRSFVVDVLQSQNFETIEAESEDEAWSIFLERENDIDYIFSDINLRNDFGWKIFRKIRERSPMIPFVVSSSFPAENYTEFDKDPNAKFLRKPFPLQALIDSTRMIHNHAEETTINL